MVDQDLVVKFWQIWRWGRPAAAPVSRDILRSLYLRVLLLKLYFGDIWIFLLGQHSFGLLLLKLLRKKLMEVWSSVGECWFQFQERLVDWVGGRRRGRRANYRQICPLLRCPRAGWSPDDDHCDDYGRGGGNLHDMMILLMKLLLLILWWFRRRIDQMQNCPLLRPRCPRLGWIYPSPPTDWHWYAEGVDMMNDASIHIISYDMNRCRIVL